MQTQDEQPTGDWFERERSIRQVMLDELTRLKRRTKAHPVRVFVLAALMTAGLVYKYSGKQPLHKARVILRVTEGELTRDANPVAARDYTNHIYHAVLTKERLIELIHRLDIYRSDRDLFGDDYAADQLKGALSVGVRRNYFFFYRSHESVPRSLRLVISFQDGDPEFAYKMAHEMAQLVMDVESESRRRISEVAVANAKKYIGKVKDEVAVTEGQLSYALVLMSYAEELKDEQAIAALTTQIDTLNSMIDSQQRNLDSLLLREAQIKLELELDRARMGLRFEIAGEVIPRAVPPPGPVILTVLGMIGFGVFLPLCAIGFGVFDSKIHELEDISRLGIPVLGHVHEFSGDRTGSLLARASAGKSWLARVAIRLRLRKIRWYA